MALKHGEELQRWEIAVAKKLVGEFRRRSRSLAREEFDDLLQECMAHWLEVRRKLDPDREGPPIAYMARVIRNKLTDLLRERSAAKRARDFDTVSLVAALAHLILVGLLQCDLVAVVFAHFGAAINDCHDLFSFAYGDAGLTRAGALASASRNDRNSPESLLAQAKSTSEMACRANAFNTFGRASSMLAR